MLPAQRRYFCSSKLRDPDRADRSSLASSPYRLVSTRRLGRRKRIRRRGVRRRLGTGVSADIGFGSGGCETGVIDVMRAGSAPRELCRASPASRPGSMCGDDFAVLARSMAPDRSHAGQAFARPDDTTSVDHRYPGTRCHPWPAWRHLMKPNLNTCEPFADRREAGTELAVSSAWLQGPSRCRNTGTATWRRARGVRSRPCAS